MLAILLEVLVFAGVMIVDLVSKALIMPYLLKQPSQSFAVWDNIIHFTYAENYGASFGIFNGKTGLLLAITGIAMALVLIALIFLNQKPKLLRYGLILLLGGGLANLVDRISLGYVRDFIDYRFLSTWFNIDFAIGNMADIFCIVGVILMAVYIIFDYKEGDLSMRFKRVKLCKPKQ